MAATSARQTRRGANARTRWVLVALVGGLAGSPTSQAQPLGELVRSTAGRCQTIAKADPGWKELAGTAIGVFARGGIALAEACRASFAVAAADPELPAQARWAALEAFARLSTLEAELPSIATVTELLAELPLGEDVLPTARRTRIELGALLVLAGRTSEAGAVLDRLPAELEAAEAPLADRLRGKLYLAWFHNDSGRPAQGLALANEVLEGRRALFGDDDTETNLARLSVAAMQYEAGDFQAAQDQYAAAASRFAATLGSQHAYTLRGRRGMALCAMARGHGDEAIGITEATLRDASQGRPADDAEVLALTVALAQVRVEGGDPAAARIDLMRAIPLLARRYGEGDDRTLQARHALSSVCVWLGDARCATAEAERVLQGYASIADPSDVRRLGAEANYAAALLITGRVEDGTRRLERAIAVGMTAHGARNRWVSAALQNLAYAYLQDGRPAEAIAPLRRIVESYDDPADLPHGRLFAERLLATAWLDTGAPGQALELLNASIERRRAAFGDRHAVTIAPRIERARALLQLGDVGGALTDADAALASLAAASGSLWRERFAVRIVRARALAAAGRPAEALAERRQLVADVEAVRATLDDSPTVRQAYLREWIPEYKQLAIDAASTGRPEEAFQVAEQARSRTLLETLASQQADLGGPTAAADRATLAALAGRVATLDEALAAAGTEARVALEAQRRQAADGLAAERRRIAARDRRYAALLQVPRADPGDAPQVLAPDDLFVSFTVLGDRLLSLAVDVHGTVTSRIVPVPGSLRDAIEAWRAWLLADPDRPPATPAWLDEGGVKLGVLRPGPAARRAASADELGRVLASWLLEPLRGPLGSARRLIVAPDPALALVPFDALPWDGRPLVASVDIVHVQSFGVLALLSRQRAARSGALPSRALIVADPAYPAAPSRLPGAAEVEGALRVTPGGSAAGVVWPRLPGTRREAISVGRLFAQSRLLLDTAASEAALQRIAAADGLRRFDVLHFATHGLISPRQPWASALVLADPGPGEAGDGYLTVAEMGRLGLAARLVVLSACDTATGNALEGEGVLGFPYVLLASGASATMLTLWPIEDAATARLMPEVLGEVRRGQAPSRALAAAKRRQLERGGARDARAWAGLLVYGL